MPPMPPDPDQTRDENPSRPPEPERLQSVARAMQLLEIIAEDGEMGVSDLARRLDVHKATASRLASTLASRGLIERDRATGRYRLGFGLIRLAGAVMANLDLVRVARPILEDLAHETRETVNLGVLAGDSVVYVDQLSGARSVVSVSWVGRRTPLHCTSNGKVLLAYMPAADRSRFLGGPLEALTPRTIVDPAALNAELEDARQRGYAKALEELEEGLNAVAAPIRQADGTVTAALSVSGPAFRMTARDLPRIGQITARSASEVSRRLGHRSPS
jgi:DNA-binding IclR family transcriptional regulator